MQNKKKYILHNIKDTFLDTFDISDSLCNKPIIEQLVHIVDRIKDEDKETNVKLLEQSEKKFHTKVLDKISSAITLRHVVLSTKMETVKIALENIYYLYTKLCNVYFFNQETQQTIEFLQGELKFIFKEKYLHRKNLSSCKKRMLILEKL